jgi:hypothetical protein
VSRESLDILEALYSVNGDDTMYVAMGNGVSILQSLSAVIRDCIFSWSITELRTGNCLSCPAMFPKTIKFVFSLVSLSYILQCRYG